MTKNEYKLFLRYLKERGLYKLFLKDSSRDKIYGRTKKEFLLKCTDATEGIMNLITWSKTILGGFLWKTEYHKYKDFFYAKNFNEIKKFTFKEIKL